MTLSDPAGAFGPLDPPSARAAVSAAGQDRHDDHGDHADGRDGYLAGLHLEVRGIRSIGIRRTLSPLWLRLPSAGSRETSRER